MGWFSKSSPPTAKGPCAACCQSDQAKDAQLSDATALRMKSLTGQPVAADAPADAPPPSLPAGAPASPCAKNAVDMAPVLQRFNRYREGLPSARAAADLNELGDKPGTEASTKPCLTRLPTDAPGLNAALGLPPGKINDDDLRNDQTGFRAAVYRDEQTGKLILVPRDTQPDSLVDWQTNTRNGIAQEAGLLNPAAQVRIFNSAGLPDNALQWTGQQNFDSLVSRTKAFSAEGDFLTYMNTTTDPGQNIVNARFLRTELAGQGKGINPINIKVRDPAMRGVDDPAFAGDKASYLSELDSQINSMQAAFDSGGTVAGFPPVRAATQETVNDSMTMAGKLFGARSDQPTLGKLAQHKMSAVLDSMESNVTKDRQSLQDFMKKCG